MAKSPPNLVKYINLQIQDTQQTPYRKISKKTMPQQQ